MLKKIKEITAKSEPQEENKPEDQSGGWQQQIVDMGSVTMKNSRGNIHCLTVVGQIEGHMVLSPNTALKIHAAYS